MPKESGPKRPSRARRSAAPSPHPAVDQPIIEKDSPEASVRSPTTETGLSVENQIRKEWDPKKQGGLPTSAKTGSR